MITQIGIHRMSERTMTVPTIFALMIITVHTNTELYSEMVLTITPL